MNPLLCWSLLAAVPHLGTQFWHFFPLVVIVSLVYGATRHERLPVILDHSMRFGIWIVGFMAVIFAVLLALSWWL